MKPLNQVFTLITNALLGLSLMGATTGRMSPSAPTRTPSDQAQPVTQRDGSVSPAAPARVLPGRRTLSPEQIPSSDGRAREIRTRRRNADSASTEAKLRSLNARVQAEQKAEVDAENAKVHTEMVKLRGGERSAYSPRLNAIRQEALAIQNRQMTASSEQKVMDATRINELFTEYERLAR